MTGFYVLLTISTIAIAVFLFLWSYFRWQKIARNNKQDWHTKTFWTSAIIAAALVIATTVYWYVSVR